MKNTFLTLCYLFCVSRLAAQQDPHFTQYMNNMSVINPAYATAEQSLINFGCFYRNQWTGIKGAPRTFGFFGHAALNSRIETGLSLLSDNIGEGSKTQTNFFADFAYLIQLTNKYKMSFGIKTGVSMLNTNFNGFQLNSGNTTTDKAFGENLKVNIPNFGVGTYYFTDKYYIGLSVPHILTGKKGLFKSRDYEFGPQQIHTFLTGGYVFLIGKAYKLKAAAMSIFVKGAPVSVDLTTNVLYDESLELGVAYRLKDAVSFLINLNLSPQLRFGYSYDYITSTLSRFSSGSHEFVLLYKLDFLQQSYDKSPRFF